MAASAARVLPAFGARQGPRVPCAARAGRHARRRRCRCPRAPSRRSLRSVCQRRWSRNALATSQRLREAFALPPDAPLPTPSLAGAVVGDAVVGDALVVVSPEAYALVAPRCAAAPGAYVRLLAHELGHRLHVAVVAGDEEAMGPRWFYEGFAVPASDDLHGLVEVTPADVWAHLDADGDDAYARCGAALRLFTRYVPLREIVAAASRTDVRDWLQARLAQADAAR